MGKRLICLAQMALKHTDAALKKYPNSQLLRALRAFSLQYLGRSEEALKVLSAIVQEGPESERVLHTMSFTYKAAKCRKDMLHAYVKAAERHPNDPDILVGLFTAYGRELDFVKQQQVALKLSKIDPHSSQQYGFWVVGCMVLQAREAFQQNRKSQAEQLMHLATTMLERQIERCNKGEVSSFEILLLYVDLLQGQGKSLEAIDAVEKFKSTKLKVESNGKQSKNSGLMNDLEHLLASLYVRKGDLQSAAKLYESLCIADPEDWVAWTLYLDCLLGFNAAPYNSMSGKETMHSSLKKISEQLSVSDMDNTRDDSKEGSHRTGVFFPVGIVGGLAAIWDFYNLSKVLVSSSDAIKGHKDEGFKKAQETLSLMMSTGNESHREIENIKIMSRGMAINSLQLALRQETSPEMLQMETLNSLKYLCWTFSCVSDVRNCLRDIRFVDKDQRLDFIRKLDHICSTKSIEIESNSQGSSGGNTDKKSMQDLQKFQCLVNAAGLCEEIAISALQDYRTAFRESAELLQTYQRYLYLSENLDPKDRGFGIELIGLAVSKLICTWQTKHRYKNILGSRVYNIRKSLNSENKNDIEGEGSLPLIAAYLALEAAHVRRPIAAPLRLSSCTLCGLLGAPNLSSEHFKALEIKNIQHESLTGHWMIPLLLGNGMDLEEARSIWVTGLLQLHEEQTIEAAEALVAAFEQRTYSKLAEFADFIDRLKRSRTKIMIDTEMTLANLRKTIQQGETPKVLKNKDSQVARKDAARIRNDGTLLDSNLNENFKNEFDAICFNDDLTQRPVWFPPKCCVPEYFASSVIAWWLPRDQLQEDVGRSEENEELCGKSKCWWTFPENKNRPVFCDPLDDDRSSKAREWKINQVSGLKQRRLVSILFKEITFAGIIPSEKCEELKHMMSFSDFSENDIEVGVSVLCSEESQDGEADQDPNRHVPLFSMYLQQILLMLGIDIHNCLNACCNPKPIDDDEKCSFSIEGIILEANKKCSYLHRLMTFISKETSVLLAEICKDSFFPSNSGVFLAASFAVEDAVWISACVPLWISIVQASLNTLPGDSKEKQLLSELTFSLKAVVETLSGALKTLEGSLQFLSDRKPDSLVDDVLETLHTYESSMLWSYETKFDPKHALYRLYEDQRATIARVQEIAHGIYHSLGRMKVEKDL